METSCFLNKCVMQSSILHNMHRYKLVLLGERSHACFQSEFVPVSSLPSSSGNGLGKERVENKRNMACIGDMLLSWNRFTFISRWRDRHSYCKYSVIFDLIIIMHIIYRAYSKTYKTTTKQSAAGSSQ